MKILSVLLYILMTVAPMKGETVNVAAASALSFAVQEMAAAFEHETGNKVHLTLGSSGNFYAQIVNGAPFDVFLSADIDYPRQLTVAAVYDRRQCNKLRDRRRSAKR